MSLFLDLLSLWRKFHQLWTNKQQRREQKEREKERKKERKSQQTTKETDGRQFSLGEADGSVRRTKRAERLEIGLRNAEHAPSRVCTLPAAESRVRIPLENEIAG